MQKTCIRLNFTNIKLIKRLIFTFIFISLPVSAFPAETYTEKPPLACKEPVSVQVIEKHSQALLDWVKKDIKGAVLINVDAHDDMRWIELEKIQKLQKIKENKDWQAFSKANSAGEDGLYNVGNFIYAAYKLGVVSKVYWVIPFRYLQEGQESLRNFLKAYSFSQEDVGTFAKKNGRYEGRCHDVPVVISDIDSLPDIERPVILTVDADFFPSFSFSYNEDILTSVSSFFKRLKEKKYPVLDITLAGSVDGGYLDITRRWIIEVCKDFLSQPEKMSGPYPEEWLVYNLADTYYYNDNSKALLDFIERFEKKYSQDVYIKIYKSFLLLVNNKIDKAFQTAKGISENNKKYAYLLADLGQCLVDKGQIDEALIFFQEAYRINPEMNFRQKNLADAFLRKEKYELSLYYYNIYREKTGLFPTAFNIGLVELKQGNIDKAGIWFNRGLESLKKERYIRLNNSVDIEGVKEAVKYFSRKGEDKKTAFIKSSLLVD